MAYYVDKFKGYMVDVANLDFIRCDGTPFAFDNATATSLTDTSNNITISGGQGRFPLAFIDTDRSLEVSFTSAEFTADMFEMANTATASVKDYGIYETDRFMVESGLILKLPFEVQPSTVLIRGLEYMAGTTPTAGKFCVANVAASGTYGEAGYTAPYSTVTFATGDVAVGDTIRVTYKRRIKDANVLSVTTLTTTSRGEVTMHWPVYSDGTDCTQANVKGYVHVRIPRARVTAAPGFDTSYKTAATNTITFSTMDAKRADKNMYDIVYEELDSNGNIITNYSGDMTWNN